MAGDWRSSPFPNLCRESGSVEPAQLRVPQGLGTTGSETQEHELMGRDAAAVSSRSYLALPVSGAKPRAYAVALGGKSAQW